MRVLGYISIKESRLGWMASGWLLDLVWVGGSRGDLRIGIWYMVYMRRFIWDVGIGYHTLEESTALFILLWKEPGGTIYCILSRNMGSRYLYGSSDGVGKEG